MANSSFDIKKENSHTKNPTSYKRFGSNLLWVHLKSKVKKTKYLGSEKTNKYRVLRQAKYKKYTVLQTTKMSNMDPIEKPG